MTVHFNEDERQKNMKENHYYHPKIDHLIENKPYWMTQGPNHVGTSEFVFWNVPQIQYKNPDVQIATIKNTTPTPFITCYLEDGEILF